MPYSYDIISRVQSYLPNSGGVEAIEASIQARLEDAVGLYDFSEAEADWTARQKMIVTMRAAYALIVPALDHFKGALKKADADGASAEYADRAKGLVEAEKTLRFQLEDALRREGLPPMDPGADGIVYEPDPDIYFIT
ncbi:MAG: hypothetical protein RLY93_20540 [Sumerlaeia bacterium]